MRTPDLVIAERKKKAVQVFLEGHAQEIAAAAEKAGSSETELREVFGNLCKKPFSASLEMFDVNKPFLAYQCRKLMNDSKCKPAEKITLMKMLLKTMGEMVEEPQQSLTVNTPKALVIVGASQRKIDKMTHPQLEEECSSATQP